MYRTFTCEELLLLDKKEVNNLRGLAVVITKRDGNVIESTIDKIMVAVNPSYLPCGFVLSDGKEVGFDSIRWIEVEK
ncbi:MAG: hypothetical protein K2G46_06040 [Bacteroidales bacterium]|nr:hypothetical protein [Bacteroidales bacterium]